jgi:glycosyltransferase involved in cell wall biosynthesis
MENNYLVLTVVIPTHNKRKDSERCIQALVQQDFPHGNFEIVVVDDGSSDDTPDHLPTIETYSVPFTYCRLEGEGPACARNEGIRNAKAPIIAFIDDDAIPQPGYLNAIYAPFANKKVVGVEGKVVPVQCEDMGLLGMSPRNLEGGVYLTCNIAFRTEALKEIGGLDESFPYPAFEDVDLVEAIKPYGEIVWQPKAEVHHPCRRWSLQRAIREIRFNEPLLLFARRYGFLGWEQKKTNWPVLSIYLSAVIKMPAGRVWKGLKGWFGKRPLQALEYTYISAMQGLLASVLVIKPILKGLRADTTRKKYL